MSFNPSNPTAADHLKMMTDPNLWPSWPILPIKRWVEGKPLMDTAVLINLSCEDSTVKYLADINMWMLNIEDVQKAWDDGPVADAAALIAEGWVVD